jgi:hypothetical protein
LLRITGTGHGRPPDPALAVAIVGGVHKRAD